MNQGSIFSACVEGQYILKFVGEIRLTLCSTLDRHIDDELSQLKPSEVYVDLSLAEYIDSTSLGLIAKLYQKSVTLDVPAPTIISCNQDITNQLVTMGFDDIFTIAHGGCPNVEDCLEQLTFVNEPESEAKERIIAAHKTLIELNQKNKEAFTDLVKALENS